MSFAGGCACGAVRYTVDGPLREVLVCHCVDCLQTAGRPWGATAAHRADLSIRESDDLRWIHAPRSNHDASRGVCSRCGTVVFWDAPARDTVSLGVETLDEAPPLAVRGHIWVEHDSAWAAESGDDGVPSFPRGSPPELPPLQWIDRP